jgi:Uma2 family endonuclease
MATAEQTVLTAEEFGLRPDVGQPEELVRGKIVMSPVPSRMHGQVCAEISRLLGNFVKAQGLGRVLTNDSGVITERNPDSVRGADVAYYSYARLPKGPFLSRYGPEIPELVFEVKSPSDRWPKIQEKVAEYLSAGVLFVTVVDPDDEAAVVYGAESAPRTLGREDELTYPDVLPGFAVVVGRLFE